PGRKIIGSADIHEFDHESTGTATAEWFHKGDGQGFNKTVVYTEKSDQVGNAIYQIIHYAGFPEHANGDQNADQVRNDFYGNVEPLFGAFYNAVVYVYFFKHGQADKGDNDQK